MSIKQDYAHLLSLAQVFLQREYSFKEFKTVDPAVFSFFQSKVQSQKSNIVPIKKEPEFLPVQLSKQNNRIPMQNTVIPPSPDPKPLQPQPELPPSEPLPPSTPPEPVKPDPKPPLIQQNKDKKAKEFLLEPLTARPLQDHREFWKIFPTLFPDWKLSETIPSDTMAQKNKNAWLREQEIPSVMILSFHDDEKQVLFLKNLAQAISLRLAPARVLSASKLEKENAWQNVLSSPSLRLIIASDYGLYLQQKLMHFYCEEPQQNKHFLNQIPLLLLSDPSLYLKEPQLKPLLWRAICNEFAASKHIKHN